MNHRKSQIIKVLITILFITAVISTFASTGWAAPDADVTDIYTPSSLVALQTFVVTVEMFNYGTAGTVPLTMYVDGIYWTTFYIPINEWSYSWVDITVTGGLTAGYHTLMFCSTNCRAEGWTWTGTPDLVLSDIYQPTSLIALSSTTITVLITNNGNADAGTFYIAMYIDGSLVNAWPYGGLGVYGALEFSITFDGGLTAGQHSIKFVADYYDDVWEQSELNNERTEYFTWTGTPDLQLTDIYQPSSLTSGTDTTITARIDNVGNADAGPFEVDMYLDGQYFATWTYSSGLQAQYYSEPSVTITGGLVDGIHSIEFIADVLGQVVESNESNNNRTESFTWTGGVPDLELTDIYQPSSLTSGTDTTITAKLTNIGYADAGPFWLDMYIDGEYVTSWDLDTGLPAWTYSEVSVNITGGLVDGTHSIEFIADVLNEVAESNEANNNRTESFTWSGGVPDLELTDIYDPTSLTSGTDTTITAKITNIGYADAGPFYVDMYIDGEYVTSWDLDTGLPARTYSEASVNITGGLVDGTHDIEFIADSLGEVSEYDEGNNNRTESFTWSGGIPDLELTDIYDPTSLVSGEDTTITAKVTNIGYADAGPFYVDLYIDGELVAYWDFFAGLPAWYYSEPYITFVGGLPSGAHDIQFIADSLNEVAESDEFNNEMTKNWTWTVPTCSSIYGTGYGVLNNYQSDIDTCEDSSGPTYTLYDISRRAGQTGHSHSGQMASDAAIETQHYADPGLMEDPDNNWDAANQASGVDAHVYAGWIYDYLNTQLSRNGFDNQGYSMVSTVEYNGPAPWNPSVNCNNNAYWNGFRVTFCTVTAGHRSMAGALDIVAHEWGHAVTDHESNLVYQNESGALNESFSDMLGAALGFAYNDPDWQHGENFNTDGSANRDLSNPPAHTSPCNGQDLPQPDHMSGYVNCTNDNGGVHLNSGIPNKMFYLLSDGDTHHGVTVQDITIGKAIQIAYRANTTYWPSNATFQNALNGMVDAAEELYGISSNEVYQVKNAWAAVGVGTLPTISTSASPAAWGTTTGDGSYEWGSSTTVTATPNTSYAFENWTESGSEVSTSASYTFTVTGDRTLVANFITIPEISVTPTSYDFGSYLIGETSPLQTFVVTNVGLEVLNITLVSITGTDASEFAIYIDICTGQALATGGNCTIQVEYSPTSEGVKNANLSISSNDPITPVLDVPLSGTGGGNDPPVANPDGSYSGIEGQAITLDGSGSYDPDGTIDLYEWDINDDGTYNYGPTASPTQNHTYIQNGTYTIRLRVTDDFGATDEATTSANISDTAPTASFTASPASGFEPLTVNFTDTSVAYDGIASRSWNFGDGSPAGSGASVFHTYTQNGTYTVTLTVTDGDGSTDTATITISVIDTAPTASFTASPASGFEPLTVNFTDTSTAYDGIASRSWNFGDGSPAGSGSSVSHTYIQDGTYSVKLTVIDSDGSTSTLTRTNYITVTSSGCLNPPVKIGATYYSTLQSAYDAVVSLDVILSQDASLTGNLNVNQPIPVTLRGGYDCGYATNDGTTILNGEMRIDSGSLKIDSGALKIEYLY